MTLIARGRLGRCLAADLLWGVGIEARHPKLREPLPRRTQSSGFEQSTDRGRPGSGARDGQRQLQGTTRRDATLLLPRGGLKERPIMFTWIRTRLQGWAHRVQQKEIERLIEEARRLKGQGLASNGGKPIRLTLEQRRRLEAMRKRIDPEVLKHIDLLADAE